MIILNCGSRITAFGILVSGLAVSSAFAQRTPAPSRTTAPPASRVLSGWRTLIPRAVIHGELNSGELFAVEMLNHNTTFRDAAANPSSHSEGPTNEQVVSL